MDTELQALHTRKLGLLQQRVTLHLQLSHLQCDEVGWYLSCFQMSPLQDEQPVIRLPEVEAVRENFRQQRITLLSELVEVRLLLGHVEDQIMTWGLN